MKKNNPHILVVDDDNKIRELLKRFLSENNFNVSTAADAKIAGEILKNFMFDLIILDVMMPGETGIEFAKKQKTKIPILFLSALGESEDRIKGLEVGADDYLAKPFEPEELILRCKTIIKRNKKEATQQIKFGDFIFDMQNKTLKKSGTLVVLNENEKEMMANFLNAKGEIISREILAASQNSNERTIDVQINRLRKKIEADPLNPNFLQTVRGKGYVFYAD